MKKLALFVLSLAFTTISFAQDILHFKKDNRTYKAKIVEITDLKVRFKKWSDLKGNTFAVDKTKLTKVVYENGKTVSFTKPTPLKPTETKTTSETKSTTETKHSGEGSTALADAHLDEKSTPKPNTHKEEIKKLYSNNNLSFGPRATMLLGTLSDQAHNGFGAAVNFDLGINENWVITGGVGFTRHRFKNNLTASGSAYITPMKIGAKYYFGEHQDGFNIEITSGIQKFRNNFKAATDTSGATISNFFLKTSAVSFTPALGFKTNGANFKVAYEMMPTKSETLSYMSFSILIDILKSGAGPKKVAAAH